MIAPVPPEETCKHCSRSGAPPAFTGTTGLYPGECSDVMCPDSVGGRHLHDGTHVLWYADNG